MRQAIFLGLLLLLFGGVQAAVVSELTLADKGLAGLTIEGEEQTQCLEVPFLASEAFTAPRNHAVFSLHLALGPMAKGDAKILFYLNEDKNAFKELLPHEITGQWYRLILPKEKLKEDNTLTVCGKTGLQTTRIEFFNDSKIGVYKMADFFQADSFTKTVSSDVPEINKPFTVYITVRNYGAEAAEVKVNYWVVEMEKVELVGGQTDFEGVIPAFNYELNQPGEKIFSYRVFPEHELQMLLPAATLEYTNIFGDDVLLRSTRPMIFVDTPEFKVDGLLSFEQALYPANYSVPGKIIVKNNSQQSVQNIVVYLTADAGLKLSKEKEQIAQLAPKETREINFSATAAQPGKFEVGCNIVYTDDEVVQYSCAKDYLFYEEEKFNAIVAFGAILAGVAVLIYLFIYYKE